MNETDLHFRIVKPNTMPQDFFENGVLKRYEKELGYNLIQAIKGGEFYSVQLNTDVVPPERSLPNHYEDGLSYVATADLRLGIIKPVTLEFAQPEKVGLWQRLKILFTGDLPLITKEKK